MEEVRKINDNYQIEIQQDKYVESPDSWGDEELFLVFDDRHFNIRRSGFNPCDINSYLNCKSELEKAIVDNDLDVQDDMEHNLRYIKDFGSDYFIFSISAYIHSGVKLSLNKGSYPFSCLFDVSSAGFILVKKDIKEDLTVEEAHKYAQGLIETWNQYLSGEVYYIELQKIREYTKCYLDSGMDSEEFIEYETIDSMGEVYRSDLESCIQDLLNSNNIIKDETT